MKKSYPIKIGLISGSTRKASINQKMTKAIAHVFKDLGAKPVIIDLGKYDMPIYNGDYEDEHGVPKATKNLVQRIKFCDGIFIATPEYNGCLPALLKNAIDWTTRTGLSQFTEPVYGIGACVPGGLSGIMALRQLNFILARLGAVVVPTQVGLPFAGQIFDEQGQLNEGRARDFSYKMAEQMLAEIKRRK
ncbi:MAG: NAD(P)H-dependent oxidoreductase [Robiginitomaculum sp.]